jgi:hypothetical protein
MKAGVGRRLERSGGERKTALRSQATTIVRMQAPSITPMRVGPSMTSRPCKAPNAAFTAATMSRKPAGPFDRVFRGLDPP